MKGPEMKSKETESAEDGKKPKGGKRNIKEEDLQT